MLAADITPLLDLFLLSVIESIRGQNLMESLVQYSIFGEREKYGPCIIQI